MEKHQNDKRNRQADSKSNRPSTKNSNKKENNSENSTAIYGKHQDLISTQDKLSTYVHRINKQEIEFTDEEIID